MKTKRKKREQMQELLHKFLHSKGIRTGKEVTTKTLLRHTTPFRLTIFIQTAVGFYCKVDRKWLQEHEGRCRIDYVLNSHNLIHVTLFNG